MTASPTEQQALAALLAAGGDPDKARWTLEVLRNAGISLADERADELVVRWVDVQVRPTPPEADTIIRTITRTIDDHSTSTTHWLDGLRAPRAAR
ncbi:MAG TPA: hypothetical protein VFX59_29960 [Polyangiales bacterium]|nr:hypothetical protein [Polyangiales bacterium]